MVTKKISARKLPGSLSKDKYVIKSMKAIQRAGFWAFIIALLVPVMMYFAFVANPTAPTNNIPYNYFYLFMAVYLGYSGWKLNRLEGPVIVMLAVNTFIGLLLMAGILPIALVVTSGFALIKIKPYKEWREADGPVKRDDQHAA